VTYVEEQVIESVESVELLSRTPPYNS